MSQFLRRGLQTVSHAGPSTPIPSLPSLTRSVPRAVKRRRELAVARANPGIPLQDIPTSSASGPKRAVERGPKLLSPQQELEFQKLRARGQYKGDEASGRKAFWNGQVKWRSRIRGVVGGKKSEVLEAIQAGDGEVVKSGGKTLSTSLVGQRVYLPNIQIRLMRNHTPPEQAYDPYIATFRIPHSMTKTDLRSYLHALYKLPITFIRTDNYFAPIKRFPGGRTAPESGSVKSYKRAVVGLVEPFHYPDDVEELYALGAANGTGSEMGDKRKEWLEENFQVEGMKEYRKKALMKYHKAVRWRSKTHDNAGNVMREIMKKRAEKEEVLRAEVTKMREEAETGSAQLAA